jgi:ribonuclease P protein component
MRRALLRLKRRSDFLRVAEARRKYAAPGLVLQARRREEADVPAAAIRVGFTVTRKLGGAVERNRARRRLKSAAEAVMPEAAAPGHDYVVIGRAATRGRPYAALLDDLRAALGALTTHRNGTR